MAKVYEIRTSYIGHGKKIRGWKSTKNVPLTEDILRSEANFEAFCDEYLAYSGHAQYASDGEIAELVLDKLDLDACEVCNANIEVGAVVYKEWP